MIDPPSWFVAMTTAPRQEPTIRECLRSMRQAGWEPVVFAEPESESTDAQTIVNDERLGVWRNWLASAQYALEKTTGGLILTVQDDSLFHPDSKSFIESIPWPDNAAFVSLYTPRHYSTGRPCGVNRIYTKSLWGACALVWNRDALEQVVSHKIAKTWMGAGASSRRGTAANIKKRKNPSLIANSDTAIGNIVNALKMSMYFVDPSPVNHFAAHSTIGHGSNKGRRNCGRCADHNIPLSKQVFR